MINPNSLPHSPPPPPRNFKAFGNTPGRDNSPLLHTAMLRRKLSHENTLRPSILGIRRAKSTDALSQSSKAVEGGGEEAGYGGERGSPKGKGKNPALNIHYMVGEPNTIKEDQERSARPGKGARGTSFSHVPKLSDQFMKIPQHVMDTVRRPTSPLLHAHMPSFSLLSSSLQSLKSSDTAAPPGSQQLTFPPLKPRGPGINISSPALPSLESPTKIINGVVLSRDQIHRITKLYTEPMKEITYWKIARHIEDEYGVIMSSMTVYEVLKSENLLPKEKRNVPGDANQSPHEEEFVVDFVEDKMFKTRIVNGVVISEDIEDRLIRLWDRGKTEVTTLRLFVQDEYGMKLPEDVVTDILKGYGRNVTNNF